MSLLTTIMTRQLLSATVLGLGLAGLGAAQPPAPSNAQDEAGEPRADTSGAPPAGAPTPRTPAPRTPRAALPAAATPGAATPAAATPGATAPDVALPGAAAAGKGAKPAPPPPKAASGDKGGTKTDRLDLGLATVTGDHEQPKVLYIVPWKKSDIGDLHGKPMNSLVDEILSPVDRDVFKREVVYYRAIQADTSPNGAGTAPTPKGEK